jgi:glycosyltransferase involved in cell wall biosynthesis
MASAEEEVASSPIRIFHVNGDEVTPVLAAFAQRGGNFGGGYNIIVPAWELPVYPAAWTGYIREFDEVWAVSRFVADSLAASGIRSTYIGQPVELPTGYFVPRRHFGIRESAFAILNFFDLSSYPARKNQESVIRVFERIRKRRPFDDIQLVIKAKNGDKNAEDWIRPLRSRIPEAVFISYPLSALQTRSLINCCDCLISLHRSEGFGRGMGEAMFLGRLAVATGWSGNLDYMTKENSLLVNYRLAPVGPNEYPFGEGQVWAEPDLDHAVFLIERAIDDRGRVRELTARGQREIRLGFGFRAVGLRVLSRVGEIYRDRFE